VVTLTGPVNRAQTNDATGFYGFVDLPPGAYAVNASYPGYPTGTGTVSVTVGTVSNLDLLLSLAGPPSVVLQPQDLTVYQGQNAGFSVVANGTPPLSYQWRFNGRISPVPPRRR